MPISLSQASRLHHPKMPLAWILIACVLSGCGPSGRDLSDAQWLGLQQDLQSERSEVGHQRDLLETDRREFDERERSEPVLAAVISSSVLLVCCLLPLVVVAVLLWPRPPEPDAETVCDIILDDVVTNMTSSESDSPRIAKSPHPRRLARREP